MYAKDFISYKNDLIGSIYIFSANNTLLFSVVLTIDSFIEHLFINAIFKKLSTRKNSTKIVQEVSQSIGTAFSSDSLRLP